MDILYSARSPYSSQQCILWQWLNDMNRGGNIAQFSGSYCMPLSLCETERSKIIKYHATHVGSIQRYHKTPIENRLNGFAWGCVQNHMDASTSPHFIHVSFDINNASVSSGAWNASKTIIKLPWKLRSCARARHTVSAQITAWKVTANKALDRGAEMGRNKKKKRGREVRDGQRWRDRDGITKGANLDIHGWWQSTDLHFCVCVWENYRHISLGGPILLTWVEIVRFMWRFS